MAYIYQQHIDPAQYRGQPDLYPIGTSAVCYPKAGVREIWVKFGDSPKTGGGSWTKVGDPRGSNLSWKQVAARTVRQVRPPKELAPMHSQYLPDGTLNVGRGRPALASQLPRLKMQHPDLLPRDGADVPLRTVADAYGMTRQMLMRRCAAYQIPVKRHRARYYFSLDVASDLNSWVYLADKEPYASDPAYVTFTDDGKVDYPW